MNCRKEGCLTYRECIRRIYAQGGIVGFYKGLTASYYGVSETVIHLVIYEAVKARLTSANQNNFNNNKESSSSNDMETLDFFKFMLAGAISKSFATVVAYPHGESSECLFLCQKILFKLSTLQLAISLLLQR